MAICYPDSVAGCSKTPWAMIASYLQAPGVSQSQTIDPLSRWHLSSALRDEWSNRMSFFTKASFLHWSQTHQISTLHVRLAGYVDLSCSKVCQSVAKAVWLTLWLCLQIPLPLLGSWVRAWDLCCFSLLPVSQCFYAILLPLSWFLMPFSFSFRILSLLCYQTLLFDGVKTVDTSNPSHKETLSAIGINSVPEKSMSIQISECDFIWK
jgi:hypothetical protein